jgi:hypothetical protein
VTGRFQHHVASFLTVLSAVLGVGLLLLLFVFLAPSGPRHYALFEPIAYGGLAVLLILLSAARLARWPGIEKGFRWWSVAAILLEGADMIMETIWFGHPTDLLLSAALMAYPTLLLATLGRWRP